METREKRQGRSSRAGAGLRTEMRHLLRIVRHENPIQADQRKNLQHVRPGIEDREAVSAFRGTAIERDERREARCINALDRAEIKRDTLAAYLRTEAREQRLIVAPYQFGGTARFACLNNHGNVWIRENADHTNLLALCLQSNAHAAGKACTERTSTRIAKNARCEDAEKKRETAAIAAAATV